MKYEPTDIDDRDQSSCREKAKELELKNILKANPELKKIKFTLRYNRKEVVTDKGVFKYQPKTFRGLKPYEIDYTGEKFKFGHKW